MKELIPRDEYGVFVNNKDTVRVSSLYVAEFFEKEHRKVMRDIRELDCSKDFHQSNFGLVKYTDKKGEKRPCYCMTRDGFTFLVMGYRGKKAACFDVGLLIAVPNYEQRKRCLEQYKEQRCL